MDIYDRIEYLLQKRGISSYVLSKETGVSTGLLSQWKSRKQKPSAKKLSVIANYFGVSIDYLMNGNETEQKETPAPQESEDDIAIELEEMMKKLESDGTLMFDGNPASPEAVRSIRTALEMGLRYARDIQKDNEGKDKK